MIKNLSNLRLSDNNKIVKYAVRIALVASILSVQTTVSILPSVTYSMDTTTITSGRVIETLATDVDVNTYNDKKSLNENIESYDRSDLDGKYMIKKKDNSLRIVSVEERIVEEARQFKLEEDARIVKEEKARQEEEEKVRQAEEKARLEEEKARQAEEERLLAEKRASKMVVSSINSARNIDIRTPSNWEEDDFNNIVPASMKPLIPVVLRMEEETGINAVYLMAVGVNETGWGKHFAGRNNYFNWTNDGVNHFNFDSLQSFCDYSIKSYKKGYLKANSFKGSPENITMEVVNTKYAVNADGSPNWHWTEVVSSVMKKLSDDRKRI